MPDSRGLAQPINPRKKQPGARSRAQNEFVSRSIRAGKLDPNAPASLFLHCEEVYKKMFEQARANVIVEGDSSISVIVYEGMLTHLIVQELHLSTPYYTSITAALKGMGCIRQLKRGGGSGKSQWELLHEPKLVEFDTYIEGKNNTATLGRIAGRPKVTGRQDMLEQQVRELNRRLSTVEAVIEALAEERINHG